MSLWPFTSKPDPEPTEVETSYPDDKTLLVAPNGYFTRPNWTDANPILREAGVHTLADLKELLNNDKAKAFKRRKLEERLKAEQEYYEEKMKELE